MAESETVESPILTVIIPAYNMAGLLARAVNSCAPVPGTEILVVDDGSHDDTVGVARGLCATYANLRVISQPNRGHGGAVQTGIEHARGRYVRVLDADDWVDGHALSVLVETLAVTTVDVCVTNYLYDKVGRRRRYPVRFRNLFPPGRVIGWDQVRRFRYHQYLMMHAITYRTRLLRESGMRLPEHTFYVDYLFAFVPLARAASLLYLDLDLYHYQIGRQGQSVSEGAMVARADQLVRINEMMTDAMPCRAEVDEGAWRYLIHYLRINTVVTKVMLTLRERGAAHAARARLDARMREARPDVAAAVGGGPFGVAQRMPGPGGTAILMGGYQAVRAVMGVN